MKIAIIGYTSILARSLIEELKQRDYELVFFGRITDVPNAEKFEIPAYPLKVSQLLNMDWVFYLAGSGVQPDDRSAHNELYEVNCYEPLRVVTELSLSQYKGNFVSFGSYFEIGDVKNRQTFNEEEIVFSEYPSLNIYSQSKRLLSRFLHDFTLKKTGFRNFHFYLPNIFDPQENTKRLIPYVIGAIRRGDEVKLSGGEQIRQYIYTKDIAEFLIQFMTMNKVDPGLYCLTSDEPCTIKMIVEEVVKTAVDSGLYVPKIIFNAAKTKDAHAPYLLLNDTKAREELSWKPKVTVAKMLNKYFELY
ncbi:MAG: NAD(P)-dependent oxidoreductase [Bacteroidota bacterium]